jgi:ergosteryl-3beta-O-L-aspartate synthase
VLTDGIAGMDGKTVTFRARIHMLRRLGAKLAFVVFRQQTVTIQGVLESSVENRHIPGKSRNWFAESVGQVSHDYDNLKLTTHLSGTESPSVSENMVRSIERYPLECIVLVTAKIRRPFQTVKNATIHDAEFEILEIHLVSTLTEHVPFTVYDVDNKNKIEDRRESESDSESSHVDEAHRGRSSLDVEKKRASRTQNRSKRSDVLGNCTNIITYLLYHYPLQSGTHADDLVRQC